MLATIDDVVQRIEPINMTIKIGNISLTLLIDLESALQCERWRVVHKQSG